MAKIESGYIQMFVFRKKEEVIEYLLLKRSEDEELYPDLWQMVTGGIEAGESAVDAAMRELQEETGIVEGTIFLVPYVSSFYFAPEDSIHMVPVFAVGVRTDQIITLSDEHQRCGWFDYDAARSLLVFPGHKEGLRYLHQGLTEASSPWFLMELSKLNTIRGTRS